MVIFLYILVIFLVLATITLFYFRVTLGFSVKMENRVTSVFITIYIFGNIAKNIMLYPSNDKKYGKQKKVRKKADINKLKESFFVLKKLFLRSLVLKDFRLYIKEGTGDAFNTAVLYGILWNFASLITNFIFKEYPVKNREVKIEPNFNEKMLKINFNCIFSLKLVNIIIMLIKFTKIYLKKKKGGDADVRSSNRRSNDYSHAKY